MTNRELAKYGMRQGAYDGANARRFVLFTTHDAAPGCETRTEFNKRRDRDNFARRTITKLENRS